MFSSFSHLLPLDDFCPRLEALRQDFTAVPGGPRPQRGDSSAATRALSSGRGIERKRGCRFTPAWRAPGCDLDRERQKSAEPTNSIFPPWRAGARVS